TSFLTDIVLASLVLARRLVNSEGGSAPLPKPPPTNRSRGQSPRSKRNIEQSAIGQEGHARFPRQPPRLRDVAATLTRLPSRSLDGRRSRSPLSALHRRLSAAEPAAVAVLDRSGHARCP